MKNHVGRPSNKEIKAKKMKKVILYLLPVVLIGGVITLVVTGNFNALMGNSVTEYYCDSSYTLKGTNCEKTITMQPNLLGDVNSDGKITINDATLISSAISNKTTEQIKQVADVNKYN